MSRFPFLFATGGMVSMIAIAVACGGDPEGSSSTSSGSSSGTSSGGTNATSGGGATSGGSGTSGSSGNTGAGRDNFTFTTETMMFEGETRTIILQKPKSFDANKMYPLIVAFHGNPASAQIMADGTPFLAAGNDAVIAYPQAFEMSNGLFDWNFQSVTADNPDMKWIKALPTALKASLLPNINTRQVFGYGYSGGSFFLTHFACRFGDVFAAIGSHSGGGPDETQFPQKANGCYTCPGGAVATLVTHGENDQGVTDVANARFTANCAVDTNVCNTTTEPTTPASCVRFEGCPKDKPVELCINPGQGHELWSEADKKSWDFFKTFVQ